MQNVFVVVVAVGLMLNVPGTMLGQVTGLPVQPGDLIGLSIWREPDLSGEFLVSRSGVAVLPRLGDVYVSEHNPESLRTFLTKEYRRYLRNPSIEVTVRRRVQVGGAVRNGGLFNLDPTVTIAGALAMAGGPTPDGRRDRVLVIRDGEIVTTILGGATSIADSPVRSGDQLVVPERSWISRNATVFSAVLSGAIGITIALIK